jgi:hypothetical protein
MAAVVKEFEVKRDPRKRFTIQAASFEHYHGKVFSDGHIELYPRVLADPTISLATLERMDEVMENLAQGRVGQPMDAAAMLKLVEDDE